VRPHERCVHLRWTPDRGGPIDFAKFVVQTSPYTERRRQQPGRIPQAWWEQHYDWLLDRIHVRLDVADGYCFGDAADLDGLCMDIWHEFAPEPERSLPRASVPSEAHVTPNGR
jgi:hypothetical protein